MVTYQNHWFFWCTLGPPHFAKILLINPKAMQPNLSIISLTSLWIHLPQSENRPFFAQHLIIKELFTDNLRISGLFLPNPLEWSQSQASLCQKPGVKIYPHQNISSILRGSNPFVCLSMPGTNAPSRRTNKNKRSVAAPTPKQPRPAPRSNTRKTAQPKHSKPCCPGTLGRLVTNTRETAQTETPPT